MSDQSLKQCPRCGRQNGLIYCPDCHGPREQPSIAEISNQMTEQGELLMEEHVERTERTEHTERTEIARPVQSEPSDAAEASANTPASPTAPSEVQNSPDVAPNESLENSTPNTESPGVSEQE